MKTVAVWKRAWLPPSETFVRNHVRSLSEWKGVPFGVSRIESVLADSNDVILFGTGVFDRIALTIFRILGSSPRVARFLRDNDVQLVHAHFGHEAILISHQCKRLGIPMIVTLHGHDISAAPRIGGLRGLRYRRRLIKMFRYASSIIAVSEFIRDLAIACGAPPAKTVVRYVGIPIDIAVPTLKSDSDPVWDIVFVGRLSDKKGVLDLLTALALLSASGSDLSLVVVGSGPLGYELRKFAYNESLRVDFLGHQTPEDVRGVLARSTMFVGPSRTAPDGDAEGFGLVFLEAALASLPVVSYAHGGVAEAVEDGVTGILCEEGNVPALADAIGTLIRNPGLARSMGKAGRERVQRDFDIRDRVRELEALYSDVTHLPGENESRP